MLTLTANDEGVILNALWNTENDCADLARKLTADAIASLGTDIQSLRLAQQFERQGREARELADRIEAEGVA